jgi:hypothetical protein
MRGMRAAYHEFLCHALKDDGLNSVVVDAAAIEAEACPQGSAVAV